MKKYSKFKTILIIISLLPFLILATRSFADTTNEDASGKEMIVAKTAQYLKEKRANASEEKLKTIANSVYEESQKYDIDYRLILAVMKVESNFKNEAISRKGARGLLQVKPALARYIGKEAGVEVEGTKSLHEPEKNIKIGVNYLSKLIDMFENLSSALHAYNAGPAKVKKTSATDGATTTSFTKKVMREYQQITEVLPDPEEQ
jgi:soluble lytic murein transglycosylase